MIKKCELCNDTGTVEMYGFKDECACKTPKKGKYKTYLELTFNGLKFRRYNVTGESETVIDSFIENIPKGVEVEFRITNNNLKIGKLYDGKMYEHCSDYVAHGDTAKFLQQA